MKLITKEGSTWTAHKLSREICKLFVDNTTLVISTTWTYEYDEIADQVNNWLNANDSNKVVIIDLYDPMYFAVPQNDRIIYLGFRDICFWLLAVDRFFISYTEQDVSPNEFKYNFLCYQRKPKIEREFIFSLLNEKQGVVTLGDQSFPDINKNIPDHKGFSEVAGDLGVPNDIWSLGNIDIWNSSFLNIVSETTHDDLFVSEKIFKPIIGMRPFICYGHYAISDCIKKLGFETFDEDFGYKPATSYIENAQQISEIVDTLDTNLYNSLLPKLKHNKNQLNSIANQEWKRVYNLAQEIKEKI